MPNTQEVEYAWEFIDPKFFRKLFKPSEVSKVSFRAERYAELRKFGRDSLELEVQPSVIKTGQQGTLDGITIYTVRGQTENHFIATMHDGTVRTFCQTHHVFLTGHGCRYCTGDTSTPVTEFEVPERIVIPPVPDGVIDSQKVEPISVICGVSDRIQNKFEQLVKDHQKVCHRRTFGVDGRWVFTFDPIDAWLEIWVKISVKCKLCGKEEVLLDDVDIEGPYANYPRTGTGWRGG